MTLMRNVVGMDRFSYSVVAENLSMLLLKQVRVVKRFSATTRKIDREFNERPLPSGGLTRSKNEEAGPLYHRTIAIMATTLGAGHLLYPVRLSDITEHHEKQLGLELSGWIKLKSEV